MEARDSFKSRLGFILVSAGCAIGIGNVWRFPYVTGEYGGAVFVLFYLLFLVILGIPVVTMELAGCRLALSDSCHLGLPAGRFRHFFIGAYLLQHRRKTRNHQGEHCHHHRFEHQLLRFPCRTTGYRMAC